ncbi:MAG TPA: fatty acid desaturase [Gemmata sp.]|nr:fatty acid desaturase [Gemmata sp.]
MIPLIIVHLALFAIPFVAFTWWTVAASAMVLGIAGLGVTIGFHRYFAHRSFETSRAFQFLLGCAGCASLQKGLIWWTVHHRLHHRHADRADDPHSPIVDGFWYSHIGWLFARDLTDYDRGIVNDLTKYRELVWLDRLWMLPGVALAAACYAWLGWAGVVYGYCATVAIAFQVTFAINSVGHLWGTRRFETGEGSRNNWVLGLLAFGEGWHNNHHRVPYSARQGFFAWYELDVSYLVIRVLAALGLVWNVKEPPASVLAGVQNHGAEVEVELTP